MKVLKKRINLSNWRDAIPYCRKEGSKHDGNGYQHAAQLLDMIKKEKMIIHIYETNDYEFKRIEKRRKNGKIKSS